MKSAPDEITVIITTHNRVVMLQRALESVLQEVRVPIKAHVFDNASADGTQDYLEELAAKDSRVVVTRNSENIGAVANYIKAFTSVKSAFFVPLADDDWLLPNFLFEGYAMLKEHPDAGAAIFFAQAVNEGGEILGTYPDQRPDVPTGYLSPGAHMRELMNYGHYLWSSILWTKATMDHVGYPFFHTGPPSDVDYQIQVFSKFPVVVTTDFGAVYYNHAAQNSSNIGMEELPLWAKLFTRVDKSVSPLFDAEEYARLRNALILRYQEAWRRTPKVAIEQRRLLPLAALAGGRLNDIETMAKLVNLIKVNEVRSGGSLRSALLQNMAKSHLTQAARVSSVRLSAEESSAYALRLEQEVARLQGVVFHAEKEAARPLRALKKMFSKLNRARKKCSTNQSG